MSDDVVVEDLGRQTGRGWDVGYTWVVTPEKPTDIPTLADFIGACDASFAFLILEYDFVRAAEPREYNPFSVFYRKDNREVEVYGEGYGQYASCDLVIDEDHLDLVFLIPAAERKALPKGQLAQVRELAARLRQHGADFLAGDTGRYATALAEWKRITTHRPVTEAHRHERELNTAVTEAGHASKRGDYAKVVQLLEPFAHELSPHQRRTLDDARERLKER
jgi:hypothetical protein